MCPVLGCTSGRTPTRPGWPRDRDGGQEVRAGGTGRGSATTGRRVRPARARRFSKDAHRKQPALGTEFRFFAGRQEAAARSARKPGPTGNCRAPRTGAATEGTGRFRAGRATRCRMASPNKNGGRHRQQQATAGTVTGETRSNRTGNGFALVLGISTRHTGPRERDPGLRAGKPRGIPLHGRIASRPGRPSSYFLFRNGFARRPLTCSARAFFACPLGGRAHGAQRWWPVPTCRGRLRRP